MYAQLPSHHSIAAASVDDIPYIDALAQNEQHAVGFLPKAALTEYIRRRQVWLARENGDPCGYAVVRRPLVLDPRVCAMIQTAVQPDARRVLHGAALVNAARLDAHDCGCTILQAWCAADLESNRFWAALGFQLIMSRPGGSARYRRQRTLHLWRSAVTGTPNLYDVRIDHRRGPGGRFIRRPMITPN